MRAPGARSTAPRREGGAYIARVIPPSVAPPTPPAIARPADAAAALDAVLQEEMRAIDALGLRRRLREVRRIEGARVIVDGREAIDFASNDYLGLAADPRLARALAAAAHDEGTGAAAARLITGHSPRHAELERALADHIGAECALLVSSGYAANTGVIPALVGGGDVVYSDALAHASLIDGCRLTRARVRIVPHGDLAALGRMLAEDAGARRRLIVAEGVYSMDGDRAPLPQLLELARAHGAWLLLDDAHALGVLGPEGRGTAAAHGLAGRVDVTVGTLGKALGTAGAFVAGSRTLIDYLRHRLRPFVFSTGTPPALAAASRAALHIVRAEPERIARASAVAAALRAALGEAGLRVPGPADGAIIPVVLGDPRLTMRVGERLLEAGFIVGAVRPPTVPEGTSRLRITASAAHDDAHIGGLVGALRSALAAEGA